MLGKSLVCTKICKFRSRHAFSQGREGGGTVEGEEEGVEEERGVIEKREMGGIEDRRGMEDGWKEKKRNHGGGKRKEKAW